jgi:hypothetical protein
MIKCEKIQKMLPDYSVGSLSAKKREFIEKHIQNCPECLKQLEHLNNIASLMDKMPQEEPPSHLWANISERITNYEEDSFWQKSFGWLWEKRIPALVSGFGMILIIASLYFLLLKPPEKMDKSIYKDIGQHTYSRWNNPLTDRVALGMIVVKNEFGDEINETNR